MAASPVHLIVNLFRLSLNASVELGGLVDLPQRLLQVSSMGVHVPVPNMR